MAIIKDFEVHIRSNGKKLPEYDPPTHAQDETSSDSSDKIQENTITRYVEVLPGQVFTIYDEINKDFCFGDADIIAFRSSIDNIAMGGMVIERGDRDRNAEQEGHVYGSLGCWKERLFTFSTACIGMRQGLIFMLRTYKSLQMIKQKSRTQKTWPN